MLRSLIVNHRLIAFAVLALGFLATPVSAAERIGYVDMARVMSESAAGKRARAEIEGMVKLKQEQISRESQKLKTLQQSLEKEQLTLTAAQKRTKQRDFDKKVQDYQQLAADTQRELGQKNVEHSRKVIVDVRAVIREIAQQEKLLLVLEKNDQPVLYAEDGPDLTDRVIKAYDAKSKK
jgi:outer membrane protein